jgi:hypothetical protein
MSDKIIKTVRVRERWLSLSKKWDSQNNKIVYYYGSAGFDKKVIVTQTGTNKRTVEGIFDKLEYKKNEVEYGEYGEDAFIFKYLNNQAGKIKKEKVWNGTSFVEDTKYSSFPDGSINLAEWIPADGVEQFKSPVYFGQSLNETDKKYRKKFGYRPPYFEIIQDPYIEGKDTKLRNFGFGKYYLNNDSYIQINWVDKNDSTVQGGDKYSDNWGRELDLSDIGEKDPGFKENNLLKRAVIYPKNDSPIVLTQEISTDSEIRNDIGFFYKRDLDVVKFDDKIWKGVSKKYGGGITDEDILDEILQKWQQVYNNTKLELFDWIGEVPLENIEYISPVMGSPIYATGSTGATGATGASTSRITGSFVFDVTKSGYLINSQLGELLIVEKQIAQDPFNPLFEDDLTDLSSEFTEVDFSGLEEIYQEPELVADEIPNFIDKDRGLGGVLENNSVNIPPVRPDSNKLKDIIKYACLSTYRPDGGDKKSAGKCARYTFNHANNFVRALLKKDSQGSKNPAGGNANQEGYFKALERMGYKRLDQGTVSKKSLIDALGNKSKWNLGDVVCYWGVNAPPSHSKAGGVIYGHTQIFTNGYHGTSNKWTSDNEGNFGCAFVYNGYLVDNWKFIIFKSPTSTDDGQKKYDVS